MHIWIIKEKWKKKKEADAEILNYDNWKVRIKYGMLSWPGKKKKKIEV
jgi:hypothetical protein